MRKHCCLWLQALAAREDAGAVFATAIFGQHTLSVATETLLQVVRRTELTAEARMAAAAVLAHLACEYKEEIGEAPAGLGSVTGRQQASRCLLRKLCGSCSSQAWLQGSGDISVRPHGSSQHLETWLQS